MASLKKINQEDLRNHNLSVLLETLLHSPKPLSRADLAKRTGLTKATISLLVARLIEANLVKEGSPNTQANFGRPSTPLAIASQGICGIGLQINTDGYGVLALDCDGTIIAQKWVEEDMLNRDPDEIFDKLDGLSKEIETTLQLRGVRIAGAGMALPGLVTEDMQLVMARNLGWEQVRLSKYNVVQRLDIQAANEANTAALAQIPGFATARNVQPITSTEFATHEQQELASAEHIHNEITHVEPTDSFIYISTSIGIGGALVSQGHIVGGDHGFAGELGHVSVDMRGSVCRCGRRGCLEAYAGWRSMVEACGIASGAAAARREYLEEFMNRVRNEDATAVAVLNKAKEALACVIASVINTVDINTVVLGGVWARFGSSMAYELNRMVERQVLSGSVAQVKVVLASVDERPALLGAAEVGLRNFIENPLQFVSFAD